MVYGKWHFHDLTKLKLFNKLSINWLYMYFALKNSWVGFSVYLWFQTLLDYCVCLHSKQKWTLKVSLISGDKSSSCLTLTYFLWLKWCVALAVGIECWISENGKKKKLQKIYVTSHTIRKFTWTLWFFTVKILSGCFLILCQIYVWSHVLLRVFSSCELFCLIQLASNYLQLIILNCWTI